MTTLSENPVIRPSDYPSSTIRTAVRSLTLTHFRNYHSARIEVDAGESVVLVGANGAGKTNLLEAISLLAPGRGFRRAPIADLDNSEDHASWSVSAEISGAQGNVQVGTGRDPESVSEREKRVIRIDGKNARSQEDLAKVFSALWLTPQMDNLFIEGGTARRKFLDRLVYSFDDEHASRVNAYELAMRERNRLLSLGKADPLWLSALEQKMAQMAVSITVARLHAVDGVMMAMQQSAHPFPKASVTLAGAVETLLSQSSALNAEDAFRVQLMQSRTQDAQAGRALLGAHRTQMEVTHCEKNRAAEHCSTGEQKALLVSIVLAQGLAGAAWHGRVPVLLLDEVTTHLDETRRHALYTALAATGAQCWLTGTDSANFAGFEAKMLQVEAGRIRK